jgi:hypothetical protein
MMGAAAAAIILGCASASQPPGAPERHTPPVILSISPESGATNTKIREVEFKFDEVVSDRPSGNATLDQLFLISPRDGSPNVSWHRSRITVRPRRGFRDNTAYRVTMLPGLSDLRGNVLKSGATVIFSTGADFPAFGIVGRAFDWQQQRPVGGAYVEAVSQADTSLVYVAASDTSGMFDVGPLAPGTYLVRALIDANSNRIIDRREKWDSTTAVVTDSRPTVELDLIERDSTPPAFTNIVAVDSVTLQLTFDQAIAPTLVLRPELFRVQRADSSVIEVASVEWGSAYARARAVADSIRRASDTTQRAAPPIRAEPVAERGAPAAAKPRAPAPENIIVLHVAPANPLRRGNYVISTHDLPNLVGNTAPLHRGFIVTPPTPRDTTNRAPGDTTRRPPPSTRR